MQAMRTVYYFLLPAYYYCVHSAKQTGFRAELEDARQLLQRHVERGVAWRDLPRMLGTTVYKAVPIVQALLPEVHWEEWYDVRQTAAGSWVRGHGPPYKVCVWGREPLDDDARPNARRALHEDNTAACDVDPPRAVARAAAEREDGAAVPPGVEHSEAAGDI